MSTRSVLINDQLTGSPTTSCAKSFGAERRRRSWRPINQRTPRCDDGSVLLLVPAGVLVLVILGAIAVDAAVVFLGQRELGSATAAAANDAAAAAFAEAPFYEGGRVEIDMSRAREVAEASFSARKPAGLVLVGPLDITVAGRQLCVAADAEVRHIFATGIPGASRVSTIRARSGATLAGPSTGGTPSSVC